MINKNSSFCILLLFTLYGCGCANYILEEPKSFSKPENCYYKNIKSYFEDIPSKTGKLGLLSRIKSDIESDLVNINLFNDGLLSELPKSKLGIRLERIFKNKNSISLRKQFLNLLYLENSFFDLHRYYSDNKDLSNAFLKAHHWVGARLNRYNFALNLKEPEIKSDTIILFKNVKNYTNLNIQFLKNAKGEFNFHILVKPKKIKIKLVNDSIIQYKIKNNKLGFDKLTLKMLNSNLRFKSKTIILDIRE
jgi:hypothetical protein